MQGTKLKQLIKEVLNELEFSNKSDFSKYNAKHKIRPATKVTVANKKTTARELQKPKEDSRMAVKWR